ncbi:NADH-Ubiquinone/plastoquinone (complex I), various chains family protein [Mycobacterium xenopi 4042]|uniref:NADH-Ubiquinone/plastoquinone (Complex I), various chains family protein n=1 Tax=Mycobacterium xenopi 4042 TaxID=1299334 RepID=X8E8E0_MYCXE|nr:NADH-Ubiquinone/plastoquinone (complex I), various chains family protein [Mycobacterium xenopi 4042]
MSALMVLLVALPLVSMLICVRAPHRVAAATTALTGIVALLLAAALVPQSLEGTISAGHYLRADALSVIFLLGTCFLYATVGVYSIGYFADEERAVRSDTADEQELFARYSTRFFLGLNAFAWSMICAPLVNSLAVLWIAVEITTVVSALLVALDNTEGATEAAWKYVLIASSGLGIALLATIFMYYSGARVLGESYDLAFDPLVAAGSQLPDTPVRLAFVLAVVGFGTKVGLFPVHTWLPDAHAEAPTPVSALLSGSLLAVSFYAILRYYQIAVAALGPRFPQTVLLVFGVLSLLLAALYLLEQRDIKRLLAYSSVEHMGIIAIGVSFGAPIAFSGCCCMSSRTLPPRPTRSWALVCSCASSAPRSSAAWRRASRCYRGQDRCSWLPFWHCRRCRHSACFAANSRSFPAASPTAATSPRSRWSSWSTWPSSA